MKILVFIILGMLAGLAAEINLGPATLQYAAGFMLAALCVLTGYLSDAYMNLEADQYYEDAIKNAGKEALKEFIYFSAAASFFAAISAISDLPLYMAAYFAMGNIIFKRISIFSKKKLFVRRDAKISSANKENENEIYNDKET